MMNFRQAIQEAGVGLLTAPGVKTGFWQGISTTSHPEMATRELLNYSIRVDDSNYTMSELHDQIGPDLPWADDHFFERVGGLPLNPPPSESYWPHSPTGNGRFKHDGLFSHTYPERYWPKFAGIGGPRRGIRFPYGDVDDLVALLVRDPLTRQAYLPVWFPEDLGAPINERKPCTLGYQFIMRDNKLHIVYNIRSCDFYRHFRNDIYLTVRLLHWVLIQLRSHDPDWDNVSAGSFTMHITSLHVFTNDYLRLKKEFACTV
jgi:hypothetical protein